jgi:hypothetical protein
MMTDWSSNFAVARQRHTADVAKAERNRLVRRSRRARRRATPEVPVTGAIIVAMPPRPKHELAHEVPGRLAS